MKKLFSLFLALTLLTGCSTAPAAEVTAPTDTEAPSEPLIPMEATPAPEYVSRFDSVTTITLSGDGITTDSDTVYTSNDIIYYEDKTEYESGNPYGEGEAYERHTAEEAAAHTVVNITAPGAYRITGTLPAGQIRIDLGDDAYEDPDAVVELILDNAHITCTVAPAILFLNTYECDGNWSTDTAQPTVDTTTAGANLILEGANTISGSHVARIYKDKEGEKKLWKQDGAIYSYMSMNVFGPGALDLTADNEGLDTELHLTINGGDIAIRSDNDGINTNEDGVSVTTINGGSLHIIAGLGAEGDGIDSNGYLVINGGTVVASANPAADAGMDSDLGSYINGGTVIALGSTMDWAESESNQVTMNLQFAQYQDSGSSIVVTREDGTVLFAYDPSADEVLGENTRRYMGAILSCPYFRQGETYHVYLDGTITGSETGGVYDVTTVTAYEGGTQLAYTGNDVGMMGGPGGFGGFGGSQRPEDMERPEMPEDFDPENMPEDMTFPEGEAPEMPEGMTPGGRGQRPEDFDPENLPEDFTMPEGEMPSMPDGEIPEDEMPEGGFGGKGQGNRNPNTTPGESNTSFYMTDKVNAFSGVTAA